MLLFVYTEDLPNQILIKKKKGCTDNTYDMCTLAKYIPK